MKRGLHLCCVFLLHTFLTKAQAPQCSGNYFYQSGQLGCMWYHPAGNPIVYLGGYYILPGNAVGLAIGPNFSSSGPNPTYWTTVSGIYHYYNGTSFVNTGHSSGGVDFINPGGSANYIYNLSSFGQVSRYDGTGSASIIATFTDCAFGDAVQDIAGDKNDNFYIIRTSIPQSLSVYDATANPLCAYSVSDCPTGGRGLAINNGTVNVLYGLQSCKTGVLTGTTVVFTSTLYLPCGQQYDLASCPSEVSLSPQITALPGAALPCQGGTLTLTSNGAANSTSCLWSGPGISGTASGQSITVSSPGVYTRTHTACSGLTDTRSFTVTQTQASLTAFQSATVWCSNGPAVTLSVSGLDNYTWTPAASLSSATGSMVSASPGANTTYTVSGQLNGCNGSTVISIAAATIPNLNPAASTPSFCAGATALLSTQITNPYLNLVWMPGNYPGPSFTVNPAQSLVYTLTATDPLGCTRSETIALNVFNVPNVTVTASKSEICDGETVLLTASGASGYLFSPGGFNSPSVSVSPQSTTIYTVTGNNWNCTNSKTFTLNVHALPQLTLATSNAGICAGETSTIGIQGADSYIWETGGTSQSIVVTPPVTTTYNVTGYSVFGCSSNISIEQKVSDCTGIEDHTAITGISIYPNPGNGSFFIDKGSFPGELTISVYDVAGKKVLTQRSSENKTQIRLEDLAKGLYIIRLSRDGREFYNGIYSLE